ncbi:MAG TPA: serine/threonine-protein kinase [Polyangia bacterium]
MFGSAVPAIVAVVLLFLVGALALLAEWRSTEARWFAVLNFSLAATSALGSASTSTAYGAAARALAFGKAADGAGALAFAALFMQLSAIARGATHPSVQRLRRLAGPAAALSLVGGALSVATPWVVGGEVWRPASGYVPTFGPAFWPLLCVILTLVAWTGALVVAIYRHGSARQRREMKWIAAGVLLFDLAGMVLLAMVLPRLGLLTLQWAPTSLAAGSIVMLGAMVLTRQHELEARDSQKSLGRRPRAQAPVAAGEQSCRACASCGAMLTPSVAMVHCPLDGGEMLDGADPWPGQTIDGRFAIEALLGAGGMGRVYRARHLKLDVPVAVKLLNADFAADRRTVERFAREARAAMRIRSPHIVTVHDFGELPPGIPFLTMEVIDGVSLNALVAGGARLSAPSVALLAVQIARGLVAAHSQGVIHRDLKPDNVLVVRGGGGDVAKIVDFGLAKIVGDQVVGGELTTMGRVFGTPAYISPEQAGGRGSSNKSDVYALGAILYRARSGRKPFEGSALELLAAHISQTPPPLGDGALDRLILALLAKSPDERPDPAAIIDGFAPLTDGTSVFAIDGQEPPARTAMDPTLPATPKPSA